MWIPAIIFLEIIFYKATLLHQVKFRVFTPVLEKTSLLVRPLCVSAQWTNRMVHRCTVFSQTIPQPTSIRFWNLPLVGSMEIKGYPIPCLAGMLYLTPTSCLAMTDTLCTMTPQSHYLRVVCMKIHQHRSRLAIAHAIQPIWVLASPAKRLRHCALTALSWPP